MVICERKNPHVNESCRILHTNKIHANQMITWDFFLGGGFMNPLQSHSKGLYKDPNDSVNHPKLLFESFETCSRHIRNYSTAENYFFTLDFRKLSPENE